MAGTDQHPTANTEVKTPEGLTDTVNLMGMGRPKILNEWASKMDLSAYPSPDGTGIHEPKSQPWRKGLQAWARPKEQKSRFDKLRGKNVLVLGGSSGIGFAVSEGALTAGARVFIASSNTEKLASALERLRAAVPSGASSLSAHTVDLANPATVDSNIESLLQSLDVSLDHIAFSAGNVTKTRPIQEATVDDIISRGIVRYFAPLMLAKHARKYMNVGAASSITLTGASTSDKPLPNYAVEAGYASGLEGMVRSLSCDLAPIRVNVIKPGAVHTEIFGRIPASFLGPVLEKMKASATTGEIGDPSDAAEAYLHSMRNRFLAGQSLSVDGGMTLK
ncbi:hypothetical protein N7501_010699 [Penicillium viridicatum]|nr:hypothetical protein N7501_010699 [Penicillium viridicatum]